MLVALSRPTLCSSVVCRPPGSSVHGILQARILKWVDVPCSRGSFQPRDRTQASCVAGGFLTALPADSLLSEGWGKPVCVGGWGRCLFSPSPSMCHLIFKDFQALFLSQSWTFFRLFPFSLPCSILISLLTVFPQYGVCLGIDIWVVASENSCVPSCSSLFWNFSKTLCTHMLLDEAKPLQFLPPVFKLACLVPVNVFWIICWFSSYSHVDSGTICALCVVYQYLFMFKQSRGREVFI